MWSLRRRMCQSSLIMIGDSCTINKRSEATISPDCGELPWIGTFWEKSGKIRAEARASFLGFSLYLLGLRL